MHEIPSLKYKYSDLEPYIDEETMRLHHTKHHQAYVDKLNTALEAYPDLAQLSVEELLLNLSKIAEFPEEVKKAIINNAGGHYNHSCFWESISPNSGQPLEQTITVLEKNFVNLEGFKEKFKATANAHFGSGWTWLISDNDELKIVTTANQNTPWSEGKKPILTLDLWEHAYYLKYQNRRAEYIDNFFKIIDWEEVEQKVASKEKML